jgi:hypothetical protein
VDSSSSFALVALGDRIPNDEAIALSPTVGWWLLACAVCVALLFIVLDDRWRRWWLSMDDPRSVALFRIVFGFFVICNVNGLWEYFTFLFTDEGIFTADVARQVFAREQFVGFGDGFTPDEPWGFFDAHAVVQFARGPKFSLLYFWDSPTAFWIHLWAFEVAAVLFMIGFRTRLMGIATFFLMNSIFLRNHLFWEGTELVYRVFLAYLVLARSGHAYSVDNWLRCRKLRKQGRLSERDGPGGGAGAPPSDEHPRGLEAVYRLIPVWPRRLLILQLATVYTYTGIVKNGAVWAKGDAFYYALNMDHFYRFYPQQMSALLGTSVFRVMTWVTHWWEALFFVVVIGMVTRWAIAQGFAPLSRWRRWAVRGCWTALAFGAGMLTWITWDVHFSPFPRRYVWPAWIVLAALVGWGWWRLGHRPFVIRSVFGRKKLEREIVLDRVWFSKWFLGRRVWLFLALVFQSHVFIMMNIGHFQTGMLSACIPFLSGLEVASILRLLGRGLARLKVPGIPADVVRGEPALPSEDPSLPHHHHDAVHLPRWSAVVALSIIVAGVLVRVWWNPSWGWWKVWLVALAFVLCMAARGWWRDRRHRKTPDDDGVRQPWAYGPIGRVLVGSLVVWHLTAVVTWLVPDKDCVSTFRGDARRVFSKWLTVTQTDQGWGMFAPNPPRSNVFLAVHVTDAQGEVWDMRTDVYAQENKPIPWIWNDRMRKMNRRIIGGESGPTDWYRKWYARWHCRNWALEHDGVAPKKVELVKVWYRIPSPEQVRANGWYSPEELLERSGSRKVEYTEHCANAIMGQLPNEIRERHGLAPLPEGQRHRRWIKHKKKAWEKRRTSAEARAR